MIGKIKYINIAIMKLIGTKAVGVDPNWIPYLKKFSKIFLRFKIRNITPARLINPLNFWVGDYPLKIEICFTLLGMNERQLLYFLFLSIVYLIFYIAVFEDFIVASLIWLTFYDFLAGGK